MAESSLWTASQAAWPLAGGVLALLVVLGRQPQSGAKSRLMWALLTLFGVLMVAPIVTLAVVSGD